MQLQQFSSETSFYRDTLAMLKEHKPDVISICTPPETHYELLRYILVHTDTKLVFCEKPVVANVSEAKAISALYAPFANTRYVVPNLTRRWNKGMKGIHDHIQKKTYGTLYRVHARYTRGILNTGSHLFDLLNWFAGNINQVMVFEQVETTADRDGDLSYSFHFKTEKDLSGYAEAFNDAFYYMFEIDLYFENGKIEISESGNKVQYLRQSPHRLFSGFNGLTVDKVEDHLLEDANLQHAVNHLADLLDGNAAPVCTLVDGLYPIYVSQAIERSYHSRCWEPVVYNKQESGL
ncbi:hypothetical protein GCM10010916_05940 [Paenibacillus abyssi]|uniref:Gfo/Idh/MocA-like oxidoreductase N-terminal domain-containing protein n=1 Tax=Paenibacillus abyssi TaxID=1340531 RepID=A0A917CKS2_9BACL|nr:hypothetical protein GCM10010916_05940 [Paenibacillus abyssi]